MLVNLEINKENLEKNLEKIRFINKNIICVIKDNAYGLGIENILPILLENNCNYFAVAYIDEAVKIREILKNFENVVIVSNEVGMGLVPAYPLGRYFREIAGKMNQFVAEKADEAYFVVSGISMKIK